MATCSSVLAWRIPWTEGPGGLQSVKSQSQTGLKQLSTHTHIMVCKRQAHPNISEAFPVSGIHNGLFRSFAPLKTFYVCVCVCARAAYLVMKSGKNECYLELI